MGARRARIYIIFASLLRCQAGGCISFDGGRVSIVKNCPLCKCWRRACGVAVPFSGLSPLPLLTWCFLFVSRQIPAAMGAGVPGDRSILFSIGGKIECGAMPPAGPLVVSPGVTWLAGCKGARFFFWGVPQIPRTRCGCRSLCGCFRFAAVIFPDLQEDLLTVSRIAAPAFLRLSVCMLSP